MLVCNVRTLTRETLHSKASGMLLKGRMGLTASMAWAVAKQLAAVSLSLSRVCILTSVSSAILALCTPPCLHYLHHQPEVVPAGVVVGVQPDGRPQRGLGQPRAAQLQVHQAQALVKNIGRKYFWLIKIFIGFTWRLCRWRG